MEHQPRQAISFAEIINLVRRRQRTLILCIGLAVVPTLIYNHITTPVYQASAVVVFENYSKDTILDFAGSAQRTNFVMNRVEEMKTRSFVTEVYDELPDSAKQMFPLPNPVPPRFNHKRYAISLMRRNLAVEPLKMTDIVTVSFSSENPELAKIVANSVTKVLQKTNLQVRRREYASVKEFVDEQIRVVQERLQNAENALRDYKASNNVTSLEQESSEVLQRITQAEVLHNQLQADKEAKQKRMEVLQQKLKEQKQDVTSSITQVSSTITTRLKEKLVDLEVRYSGLLAQNYPEKHPKMIELKAEIDQTREHLASQTREMFQKDEVKGVIDPISQMQKYLEESAMLEIELQSANAQEAHLKQTLTDYSDYLKRLPDKELTLVRLMRDKEVNNKIFVSLLEEREQARLREAAEIGNIRLMQPAERPGSPARPRTMLNLVLAVIGGTLVGLVISITAESLNEAPRNLEEIEQILKLPVLTSVPQFKRGLPVNVNGRFRRVALLNNNIIGPLTRDAYSYLWGSLQFARNGGGHVVMITSASPGEGKSTIAANLAITAARHGKKTVLIDGDLRKPVLHSLFGISTSPGLTNLVAEASQAFSYASEHDSLATAEEALDEADRTLTPWRRLSPTQAVESALGDVLQLTSAVNLRVLTKGDPIVDADILWGSPVIEEILKVLRQSAELIVIDAPPVIGMPDASFIGRYADGILFCVEAGHTDRKMLLRAQKILDSVNGKILGVVLNKVDPSSICGGSKYYRYYVRNYSSADHLRLPA